MKSLMRTHKTFLELTIFYIPLLSIVIGLNIILSKSIFTHKLASYASSIKWLIKAKHSFVLLKVRIILKYLNAKI